MTWAKNLLFVGVVLAGAGGFAFSLLPGGKPDNWRVAPSLPKDESFQATLQKVNASFREDWKSLGIATAHPADELTVARRVSLALTGTVPSLEEVRMFEGRKTPDRIAWWTLGLLHDRRYSDYMAERLARAYVGVADGPFLIYRRRRFASWLSDQLHDNRPYDAMVRDLVASDGLWTDEPATNFITATVKPDSNEGVDETLVAARVYRAFLGIRVDCAECHDHPFDRWTQDDFHHLAAFFGRTVPSFTGVRDERKRGPYEWEHHATHEKRTDDPGVPFAKELLPAEPRNNPRKRLAVWATHEDNPAFARATVNRVWALLFGKPLIEPVDNIPLDKPRQPALDILAEDFSAHGFDVQRLVQLITATEVFRLDSRDREEWSDGQAEAALEHWAVFPMTRLRPDQVSSSILQAASVQTLDYNTHVLFRVVRLIQQGQFVERYGDVGEDEFGFRAGTIPQRLLMLNGELVKDRTEENIVSNASTQIASLAPDDKLAVEAAFLACFTRRPTVEERDHFTAKLREAQDNDRRRAMEDIYATLLNATEFSWNH
ncbi:MAG: DUF1549 domain-containing protein [Planctomycetia bacterium]|nr:DUF1549 domain-containing protein [Planctomycetia bacterium]